MLILLRVSFTLSFHSALSHHHCLKLVHVVGGSLCSKETKQRQKKKRESTIQILHPPAFGSQNTKIITIASKYAMFEMIFLFVVVA